ncbi:Hypothetical predicted protein [Pelobates cultripes]|uniref:Uncharacterized protein n=1 Tax=Pelobates cultripes TaxID=61616 RepID=A0AAD1VKU1_PELCU|nr:Hypothetical predicted protein [Pelobates cultripes]
MDRWGPHRGGSLTPAGKCGTAENSEYLTYGIPKMADATFPSLNVDRVLSKLNKTFQHFWRKLSLQLHKPALQTSQEHLPESPPRRLRTQSVVLGAGRNHKRQTRLRRQLLRNVVNRPASELSNFITSSARHKRETAVRRVQQKQEEVNYYMGTVLKTAQPLSLTTHPISWISILPMEGIG